MCFVQCLMDAVFRRQLTAEQLLLLHLFTALLQMGGGLCGFLGLCLSGTVFQCLPVVFQYFNVADQLVLPLLCLLPLQLQLLQLLQLAGQFLPLGQRLRNQTVGTVGTAAVFQILQSLSQCIGGTGFITGGDKGIESPPESLVLGNGKVCQLQETCPNEYRLFYTQKHLSAVISG